MVLTLIVDAVMYLLLKVLVEMAFVEMKFVDILPLVILFPKMDTVDMLLVMIDPAGASDPVVYVVI